MTPGVPPEHLEHDLAPFAQTARASRGRRHPEAEHGFRSAYMRDRDRIVHSRAFRRLEYKTQVFVNHEGDHYRTRLTHTIEVSQIGRTVARALSLNEDLIEALCLSHDLGHTPFGHLGEEVLDGLLRDHGGFNHNRQSLRIVEHLEDRYPDFTGLNLTWEVREGIAKHSGPIVVERAPEFAAYEPDRLPPIEAQLIDLVDEIAYNHHDVDDGLGSGLIETEALASAVPLFGRAYRDSRAAHPAALPKQIRSVALRALINRLVTDLVETTRSNVEHAGLASVDEVRVAGAPMAALSAEVASLNRELKRYLREHLYQHPHIERAKDKARGILRALFERYLEEPRLMPADAAPRALKEGIHRVVADHIAGMTDRYATDEHLRLFGSSSRA